MPIETNNIIPILLVAFTTLLTLASIYLLKEKGK